MDEEEEKKIKKAQITALEYKEARLLRDLRAVRGEIEGLRRKLEKR